MWILKTIKEEKVEDDTVIEVKSDEDTPLSENSEDDETKEKSDNQTKLEESTQRRKKMEHLRLVEPLKLDGNLSANWKRFKRNFDIFMAAAELTAKADPIKINTFLNAIGAEAVEVYDTFELEDAQKESYKDVIDAFQKFCTPKTNEVYERFVFYQRKQKESEPFDAFLIDIKRLARTCEFKEREKEMLRDQIVMGTNDKKLQTRLLEIANLTYDAAVEKCRANEATREQSQSMNSAATMSVDAIRNTQSRHTPHRSRERGYRNNNNDSQQRIGGENKSSNNTNTNQNRNESQTNNTNKSDSSGIINCKNCNLTHKERQCPAYGQICRRCSKKNHYSRCCRARNVNTLTCSDSDSCSIDNDEFYITSIEKILDSAETFDGIRSPWIEEVKVNDIDVGFKIDTGADVDVLPLSVIRKLRLENAVRPTDMKLKTYGGHRIKTYGMCSLFCSYDGVSVETKFAVVDMNVIPILGLFTSRRLNIVNMPQRETNQNKS